MPPEKRTADMGARRYTYETTVTLGSNEAELDVKVTYSMEWGSPERGRFGPPEEYDPGSPTYPEDLRVETIEGHARPWCVAPMADGVLEALILDALDNEGERTAMIDAATEAEAAAYDAAEQERWEERRWEAR